MNFSTKPILTKMTFQSSSKDKYAYMANVLDALDANIAIIDSQGMILKVNKAWNLFALQNGGTLEKTGVGTNYFAACSNDNSNNSTSGNLVLQGILDVFNETIEEFYLEYPCHSPNEERWFYIRAKKIDANADVVLIEHNNISERKKVVFKLEESTTALVQTVNNHNKIINSSTDLIFTVDENGKIIFSNSASLSVLGYEMHEFIQLNYLDLVYNEDQEEARMAFKALKNTNFDLYLENRNLHKNGTIVNISWHATWDKETKTAGCRGKNQTDKVVLEKAVATEKKRFMDLYLHAPSCMGILKGPTHIYQLANPLYLKLIGKENVIGLTVKEVLPELESQGIFKFLDDVYRTGETFSAQEMLVQFDYNGDGNLVDTYLNFIYQAHRNIDGDVDGILFFAIDATEQVLSRKKIEKSERKYRQIVETAQEGIWMIDENNITTFVNSKMAEILEYTPAEMIGKEIFYFMSESRRHHAIEYLKTKKQEYYKQFSFKLLSKSGNVVWNNISANPLYNDDGSYKGALAMVTDITQRKISENQLNLQNQQLIKANAELDRFVYSVSHDLRSPLTSMLGLLTIISEESKEQETLLHAEMIRNSIYRLDDSIKSILNYSKNNRVNLLVEEIAVANAVHSVLDSLCNSTNAYGIDCQMNIDKDIVFYSDAMRFNTILENLISNAIKHHKTVGDNRFIKINAKFQSSKLYLTVEDNGQGIANKYQPKIFDMFYRVSAENEGSGIGLYIVKEAVEKIQGTITVQSEEGIGTAFSVVLKNLKP